MEFAIEIALLWGLIDTAYRMILARRASRPLVGPADKVDDSLPGRRPAVNPPLPTLRETEPTSEPVGAPNDDSDCEDPEPDPDAEFAGWPWFDDRACWGCDMGCKRSKFKPYAGQNIGAEIRGARASRARASFDDPYHAGFAPEPAAGTGRRSTVDDLWGQWCERCGSLVRRVESGLEDPPGSMVVVEPEGAMECPF